MVKDTSPHLLLVDDEAALTANLAPFLERSGFAVLVAADGTQALHLASESHPDLILLDVLMPTMDGRQVLHRLRGTGVWTPVILLTRVGEASERAAALKEGADDYIVLRQQNGRRKKWRRYEAPRDPSAGSAWPREGCMGGAGLLGRGFLNSHLLSSRRGERLGPSPVSEPLPGFSSNIRLVRPEGHRMM